MREMGVRELKQSLSATLRAVARGEQVRVTVRGRPLADIVPAGAAVDDGLRELVASGQVTPPARARPKHPPQPASAGTSAAALVRSERDAER
ncbi:MAG: type II toxin-antitoxin system prevent-host-death family antitoxin [Solirubrobacteraceae bacterium]|nr:type II toxin-antitoxin system prevent-host-death family antitoxin [Solirubrobacteraceae bacterium]